MSSDRWSTPPNAWRGILNLLSIDRFDLDVFSEWSDHISVPSRARLTKEIDALTAPWSNGRDMTYVWAQPPFSRAGLLYQGSKGKMAAVKRAYQEAKRGALVALYLPVTEPGRRSQGSWVTCLDLVCVHKVYFSGRVAHTAPPDASGSSPGPAPHACWIIAPDGFTAPSDWALKTHWRVDSETWATIAEVSGLLD